MHTSLRKLTVAWPLLLFTLFPALTHGEVVARAWVQRYNGPTNADDFAQALVVDSSNNVIVTGNTEPGLTSPDYVTIKYSSAGVPLWTNRYNGSEVASADYSWAIAVDHNDDIIVTGSASGLAGDPSDYATIKYSSAGVPLWTNRYNGPGNSWDDPWAVAVDSSNNVVVTGGSGGTGAFPNFDFATIKYSSVGVPLWTNRYNGPGNDWDEAMAVAVDGSNNVIVTGWSIGSGSGDDYATIKYSSGGVPLWTNRYNGPGNGYDYARAMAVDQNNDVIVTGESTGNGSGDDYTTIKYSGAGVPLWTNRYNGPANSGDAANSVVVDSSNNVIVTGSSTGSGSGNDYATIKYSSTGAPLWTNRYNGPGNSDDEAWSVAVDGSNNVIVTGYSYGSDGLADFATIKYSSAGVPLWTNRDKGPGTLRYYNYVANAAAVDRSNNVVVTGYSTNGISGYDITTIKYVTVPPPALTAPQPTNGTLQMRVEEVLESCTVVIEASTNLAGWCPVFTNATPTNVVFYSDPEAGNFPRRFYRAFQFP